MGMGQNLADIRYFFIFGGIWWNEGPFSSDIQLLSFNFVHEDANVLIPGPAGRRRACGELTVATSDDHVRFSCPVLIVILTSVLVCTDPHTTCVSSNVMFWTVG